jgi:hypothetical protein
LAYYNYSSENMWYQCVLKNTHSQFNYFLYFHVAIMCLINTKSNFLKQICLWFNYISVYWLSLYRLFQMVLSVVRLVRMQKIRFLDPSPPVHIVMDDPSLPFDAYVLIEWRLMVFFSLCLNAFKQLKAMCSHYILIYNII